MTNRPRPSPREGLDTLLELFSVVMVLDRDLRVRFASKTLLHYMPALAAAPTITNVFRLSRPRRLRDFEDAQRHVNSLFLMTALDNRFAVRGQLTAHPVAGDEQLVFCGAPWLSWMVAKQSGTALQLQDFSPQDVQLDQLFYMSTEARMVDDLERLNEELSTANRRVEAAQAEKDAFFARMSHEMRTPLNGIVSALSLMEGHQPAGEVADLLALASKSSVNLMQVINYVLDIAKLESGDAPAEDTPFRLGELLESVADVVRAQAIEKGLVLTSEIAPELAQGWAGREEQLRQALLNLAVNAVKFTDHGGVVIRADAAVGDHGSVRIEVQDSGIGIPREAQLKVFDPFTSMGTTEERGTGLGLDIARRNIEAMGGKIGVSSAPGVGSTFWIEVPLAAVDDEVFPGAVKVQEAPVKLAGHVLLVDDNQTNLMLGAMILESMGLSVTQAESGGDAVAMALGGEFDLVLMDISMPEMDGYEATRLIRRELDDKALPIVALSAYASSTEKARSEACGMNDYLTKPIQREQMLAVLAQWLPHGAAAGEAAQAGTGEADAVDHAVLADLLDQIGGDNLVTVIDKFLGEAVTRWSALQAAPDAQVIAREAHSLASTCRSFGLPLLADRLKRLEDSVRAGDKPDEVELERIEVELPPSLAALSEAVSAIT